MENVFVVIPAYNEGKNISKVLEQLIAKGYEIVVVDDGSADDTLDVAKRYSVHALRHKVNRGQGAALQTGTSYALKKGALIIVHFDGDGQYLVDEIESCVEPLVKDEVDIVLGSRFLKENGGVPFLKKYLIHPVSRVINNLITGIKLTDAHCGWRALNRRAGQKINIVQDGMSHNTEIVAQIKKNNLTFKEVPVTVIYNEFGQGIGGGFKILKELLIGKMVK